MDSNAGQPTELSLSNLKTFYVEISRARDRAV